MAFISTKLGELWGIQTNGEFTESAHSTLRKHEENHGFKVLKNLGTPIHQMKRLQSLTFFNSKRQGSATPLRLWKKSSSSPASTSSSSPLSSPSLLQRAMSPLGTPRRASQVFPKRFCERYPMSVETHYSTK